MLSLQGMDFPAFSRENKVFVVYIPDGDLNIFGKIRMRQESVLVRYQTLVGKSPEVVNLLSSTKDSLLFTKETYSSSTVFEILKGILRIDLPRCVVVDWHEIELDPFDAIIVLTPNQSNSKKALDQFMYHVGFCWIPNFVQRGILEVKISDGDESGVNSRPSFNPSVN